MSELLYIFRQIKTSAPSTNSDNSISYKIVKYFNNNTLSNKTQMKHHQPDISKLKNI